MYEVHRANNAVGFPDDDNDDLDPEFLSGVERMLEEVSTQHEASVFQQPEAKRVRTDGLQNGTERRPDAELASTKGELKLAKDRVKDLEKQLRQKEAALVQENLNNLKTHETWRSVEEDIRKELNGKIATLEHQLRFKDHEIKKLKRDSGRPLNSQRNAEVLQFPKQVTSKEAQTDGPASVKPRTRIVRSERLKEDYSQCLNPDWNSSRESYLSCKFGFSSPVLSVECLESEAESALESLHALTEDPALFLRPQVLGYFESLKRVLEFHSSKSNEPLSGDIVKKMSKILVVMLEALDPQCPETDDLFSAAADACVETVESHFSRSDFILVDVIQAAVEVGKQLILFASPHDRLRAVGFMVLEAVILSKPNHSWCTRSRGQYKQIAEALFSNELLESVTAGEEVLCSHALLKLVSVGLHGHRSCRSSRPSSNRGPAARCAFVIASAEFFRSLLHHFLLRFRKEYYIEKGETAGTKGALQFFRHVLQVLGNASLKQDLVKISRPVVSVLGDLDVFLEVVMSEEDLGPVLEKLISAVKDPQSLSPDQLPDVE